MRCTPDGTPYWYLDEHYIKVLQYFMISGNGGDGKPYSTLKQDLGAMVSVPTLQALKRKKLLGYVDGKWFYTYGAKLLSRATDGKFTADGNFINMLDKPFMDKLYQKGLKRDIEIWETENKNKLLNNNQ